MKKNIKYILITIIIGILIGKYIFNQYKIETKGVSKNTDDNIYLLQYGVYKEKENMTKNSENLRNYLYYKDEKGYHVIVGITKNKKISQKIVDSLSLSANIYIKGIKIDNLEFLELLEQYDSLIMQTDDNEIIINAQKQILSKYEELILKDEN